MKKIALLIISFLVLNACSPIDDSPRVHLEVLPVDSYTLPPTFTMGETYQIKMKYKRPSNCHYYEGFLYQKDLNKRTIAIETSVAENNNCVGLTDTLVEVSFNFYVTSNGSYVFRFYKGDDANGNPIYEEVEIHVV